MRIGELNVQPLGSRALLLLIFVFHHSRANHTRLIRYQPDTAPNSNKITRNPTTCPEQLERRTCYERRFPIHLYYPDVLSVPQGVLTC